MHDKTAEALDLGPPQHTTLGATMRTAIENLGGVPVGWTTGVELGKRFIEVRAAYR